MKQLLLVVWLAGFGPCGGPDGKEVAGGSAATGSASEAQPRVPPAATSPADVDACKAITRAEAEAWAGHPLAEPEGHPMPMGSDCSYRVKKPYSAVIVTFYAKDGASVLDQQKKAGMFGKPGAVDLPGIGTAAARSADGSTVGVVAHDKLAFVTCVACDALSAEKAELAAKAIASHM